MRMFAAAAVVATTGCSSLPMYGTPEPPDAGKDAAVDAGADSQGPVAIYGAPMPIDAGADAEDAQGPAPAYGAPAPGH